MTVSAPAANVWDLTVIGERAANALRLTEGDDDFPLVALEAAVATSLIDQELDRPPADAEADPPVEAFDASAVPALVAAAVLRTVAAVKGEADPLDPVALVRAQVRPWKARWGLG